MCIFFIAFWSHGILPVGRQVRHKIFPVCRQAESVVGIIPRKFYGSFHPGKLSIKNVENLLFTRSPLVFLFLHQSTSL